ncbi:hypothetical protein B0T21DRAFT_436373 [Apiosordaria backusii]|uniref:Uncharacterized protein n=1 Tax=Apiosordaria backusii TaxID=314023 RepID=A0AA40EI64_9PEZI|nr:hypothetical protein B0T21DRAFT_436373 [Apiosordaria backusii]
MSGNSSKRPSPSASRAPSPKATPPEALSRRETASRAPSSERSSTPSTTNESIFDCLFQPLPALKAVDNWLPASSTSWSNAKTEATCPSAYWDEVSIDYYVEKADKKLQSVSVRQALKSIANPILDPLMRKRVEADVVRYGNEVLVYQVWKKAAPKPGEEKHLFAMIESKSSQSLKLEEFERPRRLNGKVFIDSAGKQQKEEVESREAKLEEIKDVDNSRKTWFDGRYNRKLMAQLSKYAREANFNTNYAGLFDSNHLFLTVYSTTDHYAIRGTIVPCDSKNARKALLGWLIEAWEAECDGKNRVSPRHMEDGAASRASRSKAAASSESAPSTNLSAGQGPSGTGGLNEVRFAIRERSTSPESKTGQQTNKPQTTTSTNPSSAQSSITPSDEKKPATRPTAQPEKKTSQPPKPSDSSSSSLSSSTRVTSNPAVQKSNPRKPRLDPRTKQPMRDKNNNVIYE